MADAREVITDAIHLHPEYPTCLACRALADRVLAALSSAGFLLVHVDADTRERVARAFEAYDPNATELDWRRWHAHAALKVLSEAPRTEDGR